MFPAGCIVPDEARIADAVRELARLGAHLEDAAARARAARDEVQWRARSALAFHERASEWVDDVNRLVFLAGEARFAAATAGERTSAEHAALRAAGACS